MLNQSCLTCGRCEKGDNGRSFSCKDSSGKLHLVYATSNRRDESEVKAALADQGNDCTQFVMMQANFEKSNSPFSFGKVKRVPQTKPVEAEVGLVASPQPTLTPTQTVYSAKASAGWMVASILGGGLLSLAYLIITGTL